MLWWAVLSLTACRSTPEEPLTPLPTGQLVRLQEWYVDGHASQSTTSSADTLRWLAVDKDSYYIEHAFDSRYAYDEQNRLSQQTVNGYRNAEGRERAIWTHHYHYSPTQLTILSTVERPDHWSGPFRWAAQRNIPLNQQGLVERQPQMGDIHSGGDNGYLGVSRLLWPCLALGIQDSLRRYDAQGYLSSLIPVVYRGEKLRRLTQSVEAGNVINRYVQPVANQPTIATTERWFVEYDRSRPAIPNPHAFLGSVSRNLVLKMQYYPAGQSLPQVDYYDYEYDAKGRVVRYSISQQSQGTRILRHVGKLTYQPE